jgi:hypothetical protein
MVTPRASAIPTGFTSSPYLHGYVDNARPGSFTFGFIDIRQRRFNDAVRTRTLGEYG